MIIEFAEREALARDFVRRYNTSPSQSGWRGGPSRRGPVRQPMRPYVALARRMAVPAEPMLGLVTAFDPLLPRSLSPIEPSRSTLAA